ncbi:MAG: hypothetical protein FJZ09_04340 [Candidatus Omnitrophica bacterium]|nr:hypothetical protein [Candidatus Omnitrophota bacterium]
MKVKALTTILLFSFFCSPVYAASDDFSKVSKVVQSFKSENFLGAANTSIPIEVPPGRKELQPNITAAYSSGSGNGWLGVGWSLDFGYIERSTKGGIPKYDSTDKFYISFAGISSLLETDSTNFHNEYYPKTTPVFVKILFKSTYWEVYDKEGRKYTFGQSADSRIDNTKGTFRWFLNKIADPCGNYIAFTYYKDQGQAYPHKIEYNANETTSESPTHKVEFALEDRTDTISSYLSGYKIITAKRLKEIKTYVSGNLAKRYLFEYTYSNPAKRSLLTKFTCFGSDGTTALPSTTFTYQEPASANYSFTYTDPNIGNRIWCIEKSFAIYGNASGALTPRPKEGVSSSFAGGGHVWWEGEKVVCEDGDYWHTDEKGGLTVNLEQNAAFHAWTYVYVTADKTISIPASGTGNFYFWLNSEYATPANPAQLSLKAGSNLIEITGYNTAGACSFNLNYALSDNVARMHSNQSTIPQLAGDFNGDSLTDLATFYASTGKIKVTLSGGTDFQAEEEWLTLPGEGFPKYIGTSPVSFLLGNFDGNNATDIRAINENNQTELAISYGNAFYDEGSSGRIFTVKGKPFAADFNNDGVADIGLQADTTNAILIALCNKNHYINTASTWLSNLAGKLLVGDFNADGLTDVAAYDSSQSKISVALNKGGGFDTPATWLSGFSTSYELSTIDYNNDGLSDLMYYDKTAGKIWIIACDGNKLLSPAEYLAGFNLNDPDIAVQANDFNGDGATDFYIFNTYTKKSQLAYSSNMFTDLLIKVGNGLGAELSITYDSSGNYDNTISEALRSEYEYRNESGPGMPFTTAVVKELTVSDGIGNSWSTLFSYRGGFFDKTDREFRGFAEVSIFEDEGNQKTLYFKQDDIYKGKVYREEYKDASGNLYLKNELTLRYQTMNSTYPEAGKFTYVQQQNKYTYDGDTTYKKSYNTYEIAIYADQYYAKGDIKKVTDAGDSTKTRYRDTTYVHMTGDSLLSRPSYTCNWSYGTYGWDIYSKKWLYYDNNTDFKQAPTKGLLTKERVAISATDISPAAGSDSVNAPIIFTYSYDTYGNRITTTDPENHTTTVIYDSTYHIYPIETRNALGQSQKSTYDFKTGGVLTSTDANNQTTTYVYDTLGRLTKIIGPNDSADYPKETYEYNLTSQPMRVTKKYKTANPSAYATEYQFYDGLGRLIQTKIPAEDDSGGQTRQIAKDVQVFNRLGKVKEKYNPYFVASSDAYVLLNASAAKTAFEYDCLGRNTKITNPDSSFRTIQYSDWTQIKTDENGNQTRSTFDAFNRLVKQEEFAGSNTYTTQYAYDLMDYYPEDGKYKKLFQITDSKNNVTKILSDLADRKYKMSDPDMGTWFYAYDKAGNLKAQKDAKGQTINFDYDAINRLTRKTYPNASYITYAYDDTAKSYCRGRLSYVTDLSGRTDYYYDNLGRQVKLTRTVDGTAYTFERAYNALDQVTAIKYPDGETISYTYNKANLADNISGASTYISNVDYASGGQISRVNYGNGAYSDYTYDPSTLRLTDIRTNNGGLQNLHYQYDPAGNIAHITDYLNSATQDFLYDGLNRLTQANGSYGNYSYQYDSIGNMTYKEGKSYTYQTGARPHAVVSGSDGFSATYDANGNMTKRGSDTLTFDYDNRLTKYESALSSASVTVEIPLSSGWNYLSLPLLLDNYSVTSALSSISGKYSQLSRYNPSTAKFEHFVPNNSTYTQFTTMESGKGYQIYVTSTSGCTLRLTGRRPTTNYSVTLSSGWQMIGFPAKNRTKVSDALTGLVKGTNYDRISTYNKTTCTFSDLSTSDYLEPGQAYFIRMLRSSTWTISPRAETAQFTYDADGNRVKKTVNSSSTVYIGELYEKTGSNITKHIYLGEKRVASKTGSQISYYHPDHLGSSNSISNSSGSLAQLSEYRPFGELSRNSGNATNYYFTGKELDSTGLYYYGARYYDAAIGRFITPDPVDQNYTTPQSLNRYSYCRNNPLRYIDPTGNYELDINEIEPGDIGMQLVGTNKFSYVPMLIGESFAHCIMVLEVRKNEEDIITSIRFGDLRMNPENQRILTSERHYYQKGRRIFDKSSFFGEAIQDYKFFRVTNKPTERMRAVEKAERPEKWKIKMDPYSFIARGFGIDISLPFDSRMMCPEYLNFLYGNIFKNPADGSTMPSDIYNYQNTIPRIPRSGRNESYNYGGYLW